MTDLNDLEKLDTDAWENPSHFTVSIKINERMTKMVFDSGSSHSCIDTRFIDDFDLKHRAVQVPEGIHTANGTMYEAIECTAETFQIGSIALRDVKLGSISLEGICSKDCPGIIGADIMAIIGLVVDYATCTAYVRTKA